MKYILPLILISTVIACSKLPSKDIFREPKSEEKISVKRPSRIISEKNTNEGVFNATLDKALNATLDSLNWMKWKTFSVDAENGKIILTEAYVYMKDGKLTRIYHWPPKDQIQVSNMKEYITTISDFNNREIIKNTGFTQENMQITIAQLKPSRVRIKIDYQVFPYSKNLKLGNQIESNFYIEGLLLEKIESKISGYN